MKIFYTEACCFKRDGNQTQLTENTDGHYHNNKKNKIML